MSNHMYQMARINKDKKFDGKFFFGVKTTNIFCRPSCPSPVAKEKNVKYFNDMFDAMEDGFRPCLRCRPDINIEYYNGNVDGTLVVNKALELIYDGYLNNHTLKDLSNELYISDRHLRKLFVENLGIPPIKIAKYHKGIFAKKLLLNSDMKITDIAFASGFASVRQFNDVFKNMFGISPTDLRKNSGIKKDKSQSMEINIGYSKPFDFDSLLSFMKYRAIKGIEIVTDDSYSRTFRINDTKGYFKVTNNSSKSMLILEIFSDDVRCYMAIYNKVRKMFDLDGEFEAINNTFIDDDILSKGMIEGHVPRLPIAFNSFEFMVRAILGQQISVKAATTLAGRIAEKANHKMEGYFPEGLDFFFPNQKEFLSIELDGLGITKTRQATIESVVNALNDELFSLSKNQSFENFSKDFSQIKGIGDWTVNYVAMRGLGMIDSFPASDLGIIKALTTDDEKPSQKEISKMSNKWRPYRAYAALCLWNYAHEKELK